MRNLRTLTQITISQENEYSKMVKTRELTESERVAIEYVREAGHSFAEIARQVGCSKSGAFKVFKSIVKTGSIVKQPRSGRPRKFLERGERAICRVARKLRFGTLGELKTAVSEDSPAENPSKRLVKRILQKYGLKSCKRKRKPFFFVEKQVLPFEMGEGNA